MVQTIPTDNFAIVLLTRSEDASTAFRRQFFPDWPGVSIIMSPLMKIVDLKPDLDFTGYKGVIFTSANGVRHCTRNPDLPAYCIGRATTQTAKRHGWKAQQVGATADTLVETLIAKEPNCPLLHIGGRHRRGDISARLSRAGLKTTSIDVYDQLLLPLNAQARSAMKGAIPIIVPLFSPRTARQFARNADFTAPVHIVAMSEAVLSELRDLPYVTSHISKAPDAESVSVTLQKVLRRVEADAAPQ